MEVAVSAVTATTGSSSTLGSARTGLKIQQLNSVGQLLAGNEGKLGIYVFWRETSCLSFWHSQNMNNLAHCTLHDGGNRGIRVGMI